MFTTGRYLSQAAVANSSSANLHTMAGAARVILKALVAIGLLVLVGFGVYRHIHPHHKPVSPNSVGHWLRSFFVDDMRDHAPHDSHELWGQLTTSDSWLWTKGAEKAKTEAQKMKKVNLRANLASFLGELLCFVVALLLYWRCCIGPIRKVYMRYVYDKSTSVTTKRKWCPKNKITD